MCCIPSTGLSSCDTGRSLQPSPEGGWVAAMGATAAEAVEAVETVETDLVVVTAD